MAADKKYLTYAALAKTLEENIDYKIDEKQKASTLTEE
jgi:preprotein translocase subunit SecA